MNVVGINKRTNAVFESQSYRNDEEKKAIATAITADAESLRIEITISEMTDEELQNTISN